MVDVQCAIALRDGGPSTIAQLARRVGSSRPTVEGGLASLTARGLVRVDPEVAGGGRDAGRPAKVFRFNGHAGRVAGIDVGGHLVRVVVTDLAGAVIASDELPLDPDHGGSQAFELICALLDALLEQSDESGPLLGIAVAVAGLVGVDGRVAVSYALPMWQAADIAGRLRTRYGCAAVIENDARLASMAEHLLGASVLVDDVVYIHVGRRISISLLVGGRVHRGRHHASGEAGYLLFGGVDTDDATNILWRTAPTAEEVVGRYLLGHRDSTEELTTFLGALAPGIAALALVTDPDLIVLGGGLSRAGNVVIGALTTAVAAQIRLPAMPTLVQSDLGAQAVVVGAVLRGHELAAATVFATEDVVPPRAGLRAMLHADAGRTSAANPTARSADAGSPTSSPTHHLTPDK